MQNTVVKPSERQQHYAFDNLKLVGLDADGVIRISETVVKQSLKLGVESQGLKLPFDSEDLARIRSVQHYCDAEGAKVLIAVQREGANLKKVLASPDLEKVLDDLVAKHIKQEDAPLLEAIRKSHDEVFNSDGRGRFVRMVPGAREAIQRIRDSGYKVVLFSNAPLVTNRPDGYPNIDMKLFDAILLKGQTVSDKVIPGKPSGEALKVLMEMFGVTPAETVYVGDTKSDIRVARNAGVQSVSVLSGDGKKEDFISEKTDFAFPNLLAFSKYIELPKNSDPNPIPLETETKITDQAKPAQLTMAQLTKKKAEINFKYPISGMLRDPNGSVPQMGVYERSVTMRDGRMLLDAPFIHYPDQVAVTPVVREADGTFSIVLLNRYMEAKNTFMLQVPMDPIKAGEASIQAAQQALTVNGLIGKAVFQAKALPAPGWLEQSIETYRAEVDSAVVAPRINPFEEKVEIVKISADDFRRKVKDNEISDLTTIVAGYRTLSDLGLLNMAPASAQLPSTIELFNTKMEGNPRVAMKPSNISIRRDTTGNIVGFDYEKGSINAHIERVVTPSGIEKDALIISAVGGAMAVSILRAEDGLRFAFVKQYRGAMDVKTVENPMGAANKGEEFPDAARREASEEGGFNTRTIIHLAEISPAPFWNKETQHWFMAEIGKEKGEIHPDELEKIEGRSFVHIDQVKAMLRDREIIDLKTEGALWLALETLGRI